jgi:predicted RNase H-like nuclease (RuvC/YqgF family)
VKPKPADPPLDQQLADLVARIVKLETRKLPIAIHTAETPQFVQRLDRLVQRLDRLERELDGLRNRHENLHRRVEEDHRRLVEDTWQATGNHMRGYLPIIGDLERAGKTYFDRIGALENRLAVLDMRTLRDFGERLLALADRMSALEQSVAPLAALPSPSRSRRQKEVRS